MKQIADKDSRIFLLKNLDLLALGVIVLTVSVPLMTNYCIDGVNVSFYLHCLESICPEDIFLLLPSLLVNAGIPVEFLYKLILFTLNIATSAIAYYCFRGIFCDRLTGIIGSMLYTWAPYRLNDLYCRADLGESVALCFLPIIFYGLYRVYYDDTNSRHYKRLWIILALGYTLIVQSYLLSFLVAAGFSVLFCLVMWKKTFRKQVLITLMKTIAAFLICNLWLFLLLLRRIREGIFSMAAFRGELIQNRGVFPSVFLQLFFLNGSSFQTARTGTKNIQPLGVGFAITVGVLAYLWIIFVRKYQDIADENGIRSLSKYMGITGAIIAVMSTNSFPWDYLQKRNYVFFRLCECLQSPARLMPVILLCFTVLTCAAVWLVRKWEIPSIGMTFAIVIAVLALTSTQYLTGDILRTGVPRSLYGVEYGETLRMERLLPENLDISPLDYGKYESSEN